MRVHGDLGGEGEEFLLHPVELAQMAVERIAAEGIEREGFEPGDVLHRKQIGGRGGDEPLMEHGVDAVLDSGAVGGEHGSLGGALAHEAGGVIGDPDFGQVIGAKQLSQDQGVDLVGFDFGAGDGFGAEGIADDELVNQRLKDGGDGPGVGGGFDGDDAVPRRQAGGGEGFKRGSGGGETGAVEDAAVLGEQDGFDFFLVEIQTGECHTVRVLCELAFAAFSGCRQGG